MHGETISGLHVGEPTGDFDEQGNPIVGEPIPFQIRRCLLAPTGTDENSESFGAQTITAAHVYVIGSVPAIVPSDQVTFWGEHWQIDGNVGPWSNGRLKGSEFGVKRVG